VEKLPAPSHPYASGGGGTVLEHRLGAVLLTHVLTEVPLPALGADVTPAEVIFQAPGTKVDDFLVRGCTTAGIQRELAIAVRRRPTLKPSDAPSVKLFRSFLDEMRQHQDDLTSGHRRLALALEGPAGLARDLTELTNCARAQPNAQAFRDHVATRRARTLRERLQRLDQMVKAASEGAGTGDDQTWFLLSSLYVVELRLQNGQDGDRADAVFRLSRQVTDGDLDAASRCFDRILNLAQDFAPEGAHVNQAMLAVRLGLTPRTVGGAVLEEYIRRFLTHRQRDLAAAVPLTITTASGTELPSDTAATHLKAARHVHIVGPSGAGKTVALIQIAAQLVHEDKLPIWLTARSYGQHGLGVLLDSAVAPYSELGAYELMQGAATHQKPVVLLVDGLNECPPDVQKELLNELNAWCLREPVTVVTTGQERCNAPEPLAGATWSIEPPSSEQRDRILAAYGADASDSAFALFRHPLELALAAKLHGAFPARAGTGVLLDSYVRMRLSGSARPAAARAVLRAWARAMDRQLRSSLSLGEAERLASRVDGADVPDVLACGLVEVEGQHLAFAHERFQRLLAAEAIVLDHLDDPTVLARELQAPSRADLVALAATFAPDIEAVQAIMEAAPASRTFADALQGRLGPVPEQFMDREARRLLSHATRLMATCSLHFETDFQLAITPPSTWSSYEAAVFAAVGTVLHDGVLLRETMLLLDATDTTLASATAAEPQTLPHHIGSALIGLYRTEVYQGCWTRILI
jgi:hypothetical protein